jgi:hypothetical protein
MSCKLCLKKIHIEIFDAATKFSKRCRENNFFVSDSSTWKFRLKAAFCLKGQAFMSSGSCPQRSSGIVKSNSGSADKKVDQIHSSKPVIRFCFRCKVSNQSESWKRFEPCFSNIVRKGRGILTAAALVQMEFLTK